MYESSYPIEVQWGVSVYMHSEFISPNENDFGHVSWRSESTHVHRL